MNKARGFSLIELMVVIAIIAILASVAAPSYKKYVVRTQITNIITSLEPRKNDVIDALNNNGVQDANYCGTMASFSASGCFGDANVGYVGLSQPTLTGGIAPVLQISACLQNFGISGVDTSCVVLQGKTRVALGPVVWRCAASANIPRQYLPDTCNADSSIDW